MSNESYLFRPLYDLLFIDVILSNFIRPFNYSKISLKVQLKAKSLLNRNNKSRVFILNLKKKKKKNKRRLVEEKIDKR